MPVLYVKEQGAYIKKSGLRVVVQKNGKTLFDIPVSDVSGITVIGNVQLSTQVIKMLLENGSGIGFFSRSGKYLGMIDGSSSKNIIFRLKQYDLFNNTQYRMQIAKTIVTNKVNNQISIIKNFRFQKEERFNEKEIV